MYKINDAIERKANRSTMFIEKKHKILNILFLINYFNKVQIWKNISTQWKYVVELYEIYKIYLRETNIALKLYLLKYLKTSPNFICLHV